MSTSQMHLGKSNFIALAHEKCLPHRVCLNLNGGILQSTNCHFLLSSPGGAGVFNPDQQPVNVSSVKQALLTTATDRLKPHQLYGCVLY